MSSQIPSNKIHRSLEGFEYAQVRGPDIIIRYGIHDVGEWRQPPRNDYQILIFPEPDCEAELSWRGGGGKTNRRQIGGPHICTVEKQTALTVRWIRRAAFVTLAVSENFVARNGGHAAMAGVTIESEFEYAYSKIEMLDSDERLAKLCRDPNALPPDQIHGWGLIQASRIILARSCPPLGKKTPGLSVAQMEKIDKYIETHIQDDISVEILARVAGVGTDQFARLFRKTKGKPPYQHVLRRKTEHAQRRMKEAGLSKCEIAHEVGFNDESHLRKTILRQCAKSQKKRDCPENNTGLSNTQAEKPGTLMVTL